MGTFIGHVAPGAGFLLIGLWHLFNTIRNYAQSPWEFETRPWFPTRLFKGKLKHLELYAIMFGSLLSIAAELFIGPKRHQPLADDLSIPPEHLNNFEHSTISLFLFIYALCALIVDERWRGGEGGLPAGFVHAMGAIAFSQELLLFHLHSADHMGLEGHYHWLLQLVIWVSLGSTMLEGACPQSVLVAMVRSLSIVFQGVWFMQMGFVLWVPAFTPKRCRLRDEAMHRVVRCDDEASTARAKALATLQFSWYLAAIIVFSITSFAYAVKYYGSHAKYQAIDEAAAEQGSGPNVQLSIPPYKTRSFNGSHSDGSHSSMEDFPAVNLER